MQVWLYVQKNHERSTLARRVVERVCASRSVAFEEVDVDTVHGLVKAIEHNIVATPTVVLARQGLFFRVQGDITEQELAQHFS